MKKIIGFIFLASFLAIGNSAYAVTICQGKTLVVYGNGMFNTPYGAKVSMLKLQNTFKNSLPASSTLRAELAPFKLAYADNGGATGPGSLSGLRQLLEVYIQKRGDSTSYFWRLLASIDIAPTWFQQAMKNIAAQATTRVYANDADLQSHLNTIYRPALQEGKRVLIVSHSQGNFYANAAYSALSGQFAANVGNVQVASPASFVASGGPYVTASEDLVIGAITAAAALGVPGIVPPLPANVTNAGDGTSQDVMGHSFTKHYMRGFSTQPMILSNMSAMLQSLQYPQATLASGAVTVTLTWTHATDVDLHVFEPSGAHVFYARRQGVNGFLDVDNTWGFGPEHYFIACNTIQPGNYAVGVNYYSGSARPETATVQIKAGTAVKSFSRVLAAPRFSGGNASPVPVANIAVTKNPLGGFDYTVQ